MADTTSTTTPHRLSPQDESRVKLAFYAWSAASAAFELVPVDPDAAPGDLLRAALSLQRSVESVVSSAIVAERERGTTWEQIAQAAQMTRQSAHERWKSQVSVWSEMGRVCSPEKPALEIAAFFDKAYADYVPGEAPAPVSSGLDAIRFPEGPNNRHQHDRAQALHTRRVDLERARKHWEEERITSDDATTREDWLHLAANRSGAARTYDGLAQVHDELITVEPALADEHRATAEQFRTWARDARSYSKLAMDQAQKTGSAG